MLAVIDSNVLYSGLYSNQGASYQILNMIRNGQITPVISVAVCEEYLDVLGRPPLADEFTEKEKNAVVDFLCSVACLTEIFFLWRPFLRDPKDDLILEAAVAAGCKTIISHNIRHFKGIGTFGVQALPPKEILKALPKP